MGKSIEAAELLCASGGIGIERVLAELLAEVVRAERVSVDSHFFDDLGADSMLMARFCARVRKRADLPTVSMKDVYRNSTISSLARALAQSGPTTIQTRAPASIEPGTAFARRGQHRATHSGTPRYILCGTLQLLFLLGYSYLATLIAVRGIEWIAAGAGFVDFYARSVVFGSASAVGLCGLPILAKWMLIGRWEPRQFRVWSLTYFRFWVVKTLIQSNPLVLFVGSPLYVLYLRMLGARIGRGVAIFSSNVPVCTDLLAIDNGTVIRKDSFFNCYRAHDGVIQTGAIVLGSEVLVGEKTVLDINTCMGDRAQLGHTSALYAGQAVPEGERWHGSPAQRTEVNYRTLDSAQRGSLRKVVYVVLQLLNLLVLPPLVISATISILSDLPQVTALLGPQLAVTSWTFYLHAMVISVVLTFGAALLGFLLVVTVPRILGLAIEPDKIYHLYGFHYWAHRVIARMTNIKFFTYLFGDSSYIVCYLSILGYKLSPVEQTGSNFGMDLQHENPYLSSVGSGTMVADGLSMTNSDLSSTSFRLSRVSIGRHNFLGNAIAYPAQGKTGDNCLLATKVMIPVAGEIRENVGLLGSPSFEIPRTVERDTGFDLESADELHRKLAAKNRHNAVTMGLYLLVGWIYSLVVTAFTAAATDLHQPFGAQVITLVSIPILLFSVAYFVVVARIVTGFQALAPLGCSIYDRRFWRHERYWKLSVLANFPIFNGTPFKSVVWRLLGVRVGRRLFDDGCDIVEKTFVAIGDDCTLNAGSVIQCHSQEDGAFKSDHSTIGAGCTLGVGAFVHYGVTMGDGATLAPDSFLMKGAEIASGEHWGGNPAMAIGAEPPWYSEPIRTTKKPRLSAVSGAVTT